MNVDIDFVIERERVTRRAVVQLRQLIQKFEQTDAATLTPEDWRIKAMLSLRLAESSLEWGLATSKMLKSVVTAGRDLETPDEWSL